MTERRHEPTTVVIEVDGQHGACRVRRITAVEHGAARLTDAYAEIEDCAAFEAPLAAESLRAWERYDLGCAPHLQGAADLPAPVAGEDGTELGRFYETLADRLTVREDDAEDLFGDSTWAFLWPRTVVGDEENLRAHAGCFARAMRGRDLPGARFIAIDRAAAQEAARRVTPDAYAANAAAYPADELLLAGAASIALSWDRGQHHARELRLRLAGAAGDEVEGPAALGRLLNATDGMVALAWDGIVEEALAALEVAVRDEARARATGEPSAFRRRAGWQRIYGSDSVFAVSAQVEQGVLDGETVRMEERIFDLMVRYVYALTGAPIACAGLVCEASDDRAARPFRLHQDDRIVRAFRDTALRLLHDLPWPALGGVGAGTTRDEASCLQEDIDAVAAEVGRRSDLIRAELLGLAPVLFDGAGASLAATAWKRVGAYAHAACDTTGGMLGLQSPGLWAYDPHPCG